MAAKKGFENFSFDEPNLQENEIPEPPNHRHKLAKFVGGLLVVILIVMLLLYFFTAGGTYDLNITPTNPNFVINNASVDMQFYPNMRFSGNEISYKINECNIEKSYEMREAFSILENVTNLAFYEISESPEILVECQDTNVIEGGLFIAGEGGPTSIIQTDSYNVILEGKILLIRDSDCARPNVALHELLHVLGFKHSENKENIMYNFSRCDQDIGQDIIDLLNELYSAQTLPDLKISDAFASVHGRYVDINMSVKNEGLKASNPSEIEIYINNGLEKELALEGLEVGYGKTISLSNLFVPNLNINQVKIIVQSTDQELSKENNVAVLSVSG